MEGECERPEWLDEAAEVYCVVELPRTYPAPEAERAKEALEAAGIPCYLEVGEEPEEEIVDSPPRHEWRVLVPGNLNLQAASTLERDIFNIEFEDEWKTHLESLTDREVIALRPETVFCGLFDRIERVKRVYRDEMTRRRL